MLCFVHITVWVGVGSPNCPSVLQETQVCSDINWKLTAAMACGGVSVPLSPRHCSALTPAAHSDISRVKVRTSNTNKWLPNVTLSPRVKQWGETLGLFHDDVHQSLISWWRKWLCCNPETFNQQFMFYHAVSQLCHHLATTALNARGRFKTGVSAASRFCFCPT